MWNHLQSAAGTATLTHPPASPFPPLDLHFEYSAYIEEQQKRVSRQLLDLQLQLANSSKQSPSTPSSALTSPTSSLHSPSTDAIAHSRKRSTLLRLHTYHDGLIRRRKTQDADSLCNLELPATPRYEIWGGKAVPATVSVFVSKSSSFQDGSPCVSDASTRFATTTVPSDRSGKSPQNSSSSHPLAYSPEATCTLPQLDSALEQRHNHRDSCHPDSESNPPLNGIRRVKSDLNWQTALSSHEARSRVTYHGLVTQSMYAYGHSKAGPVEPISPPSSPDLTEQLNYDVSPIDDEDEDWELPQQYYLRSEESSPTTKHQQPPQQGSTEKPESRSRSSSAASNQKPRNNIPAMRRERRKLQDAAAKANREQKLTGLPHSKHPDSPHGNSGAGLDPSMADGPRGVTPDPTQMYGSTTTITANNQQHRRNFNASPSFGERMRQFGKGKPEPIESRPAWNGASGRQAVVEPLRDDLSAAPLKVNTQNSKRPHGRTQAADKSGPETSYSTSAAAAAAVRKFMPSRSGQTANGREFIHVQPAAATYGASSSIPLATGAPTRNAAPPHETPRDGPASNGPPRPDYFNQEKAIKRKPPPSTLHAPVPSHTAQPSISSSVYSTQAESRSRTESPQLGLIQSDESELTGPWVAPPPPPAPAFSESTTPSTSSPASPAPIPETDQTQTASIPSVMERRRPLRGKDSPQEPSGEDPIVISLRTANYQKPREADAMSTGKDLPLAPPEMIESADRVAVLSAKLLGLAHRRNNINKSIQQMTELMPKDMLLSSIEVQRKREDEKRKVELLKQELADIQQQEFDLGLKLHRANKRRERESEFEEGGSLWIRRITG